MKKKTFSIILLTSLLLFSCAQDDVIDALGLTPVSLAPLDALASLNCLSAANTLDELNDDENPTCSEVITVLNKLKNDCGDEDGSIQDLIDLYEVDCDN